ncbi:GTPase, partial [Reticulomyxa filosa]
MTQNVFECFSVTEIMLLFYLQEKHFIVCLSLNTFCFVFLCCLSFVGYGDSLFFLFSNAAPAFLKEILYSSTNTVIGEFLTKSFLQDCKHITQCEMFMQLNFQKKFYFSLLQKKRREQKGKKRYQKKKYVSSLTDEQKNELVKTSADLTAERNLKRLELRLEEALDQRNQATEVIKNLAKENEEMKMENEELKSMVHMKEHDLKLLTKDNALLNELYEEEKIKYEAELLKLEKLKQDM